MNNDNDNKSFLEKEILGGTKNKYGIPGFFSLSCCSCCICILLLTIIFIFSKPNIPELPPLLPDPGCM